MTNGARYAPRLGRNEIVARYIGGLHVDHSTGQINGSAFERAQKDVDGVSFTRRNMLAHDVEDDRVAIRRIVGSRLRLGATAVFAELRIGTATEVLSEFDQDEFFVEDPLPAAPAELANPAHALMIGFPFKGESIGSLKSEVAGDRLRACIIDWFVAVVPD